MNRKYRVAISNIITVSVFLFVAVKFVGYFKQNPLNPAIISDPGDYYLIYYHIIECNLVAFIFGLLVSCKSFLFKSCIYTRVAAIMCLLTTFVDLLHSIFVFDFEIYLNAFTMIMYSGIVLLVFLYLMTPIAKRQ